MKTANPSITPEDFLLNTDLGADKRIVIISSCTGKKVVPGGPLTLAEFKKGPEHVAEVEAFYASLQAPGVRALYPAEELYTGQQHLRLMKGVESIRERLGYEVVDLHILSAGYGLVDGCRQLAPYEATFGDMTKAEGRAWGKELGVPQALQAALAEPYDIALILLGDDYLNACNIGPELQLNGPTFFLCGKGSAAKLPTLPELVTVPVANPDAKTFSCGMVGLKGELVARLLQC